MTVSETGGQGHGCRYVRFLSSNILAQELSVRCLESQKKNNLKQEAVKCVSVQVLVNNSLFRKGHFLFPADFFATVWLEIDRKQVLATRSMSRETETPAEERRNHCKDVCSRLKAEATFALTFKFNC